MEDIAMIFTLKQIFPFIDNSRIAKYHNPKPEKTYTGTILLKQDMSFPEDDLVYIGYASLLPSHFRYKNAAFILINNCGYNFAQHTQEVIELENRITPEALFDLVQTHLLAVAERHGTMKELLSALFKEKSIKEILDLSHDFLHNPLVLFGKDKMSTVLFSSTGDISKELTPYFEAQKTDVRTPISLFNYFEGPKLGTGCIPVLFEDGLCFKGRRRIASMLDNYNDLLGVITLFEIDKTFVDTDLMHMEIISQLISEKLRTVEFRNDYYKHQCEQNIQDLISGKMISDDDRWIILINGKKYQNFIVALIDVSRFGQRELSQLKLDLNMKFRHCFIVGRGSYLVILANLKDDVEAAAFEEYLFGISGYVPTTIGVSDPFSNIMELKKYYTQAKKSRELGERFHKTKSVVKFRDIKSYMLFDEISDPATLKVYISGDYTKLKEYDKMKDTEYMKTLLCYIVNNANRQAVCNQLSIHRNTLQQRLSRIITLLSHNLTESDFLFDMYFSSMIDNYASPSNFASTNQ